MFPHAPQPRLAQFMRRICCRAGAFAQARHLRFVPTFRAGLCPLAARGVARAVERPLCVRERRRSLDALALRLHYRHRSLLRRFAPLRRRESVRYHRHRVPTRSCVYRYARVVARGRRPVARDRMPVGVDLRGALARARRPLRDEALGPVRRIATPRDNRCVRVRVGRDSVAAADGLG